MPTLEEMLTEALKLGYSQDEILRIASEIEKTYYSPPHFDMMIWEAIETLKRGLAHHPSVQRIIDLRIRGGMPEELATTFD
jgi:hypothetical protein